MQQIIREAERAIEAVKNWKAMSLLKLPKEAKAKAFMGSADGWVFNVVAFSIEDQGFPPGSRGYDGTGTKQTTILRLPRPLAEKAFKLAEKQTSGLNGLPVREVVGHHVADAEDRAAYRLAQLSKEGVKARLGTRRDGSLVIRLPDGTIEDV